MTNKPMLSVERDLIERAVQAIINTSQMQPALNELRALLDKPCCDHEFESPVLSSMSDYCAKFHEDKPAAQHQGEPVACNHEWTDDGEYLLVCAACGAQEDHTPGWRDMSTAPRDGTMLRLLVEFEEHPTEDEDQAPTIGANNFDNDDVDEWKFSGWCWTHDHFVQGKGVPVGWLPMLDAPKVTNGTEQPAPVAVVMPDNLVSHRDSWLQAMERLVALEAEATPATHDSDEAGYWEHELKAMRAMYADLDRLNGVKP